MTKQTYCIIASASLLVVGVCFGVAGFIVPPVGEVADSVLMLIAQCFITSGTFVGIDAVVTNKIKKLTQNNSLNNSSNESTINNN